MVSNPPRGSAGDGPEITIPVFNSEYRGVMALPPAKQTEATIKIVVRGQVVNPGVYNVREGTSILQAIEVAGGFTDYADSRGVTALDGQRRVRLRFHHLKRTRRLPLVWYGDQNGRDIFVVKDGMTIFVPLYF